MATNNSPKVWWASKTVGFNLLAAAPLVLDWIGQLPTELLPENWRGPFATGVVVGNLILRGFTKQGLTLQKPKGATSDS